MTAPVHLFLMACLYPGGVLDRSRLPSLTQRHTHSTNLPGPPDYAFRRFDQRRVQIQPAPVRDLVMTGDQIYVDATAGLFDPLQRDQPLERAYSALSSQEWRKLAMNQLEAVALMDDHEVGDNWEPSADEERNDQLRRQMKQARAMFLKSQRSRPRNDALVQSYKLSSGHVLFAGDTRSERTVRDAALLNAARIMSPGQLLGLVDTLARAPRDQWKFAATSSILLPRRLATAHGPLSSGIRSDAWDGYPASLHELLGRVADADLQHCVFLSGDEHIPCVAEITLRACDSKIPSVKLWSVHAGALYAPYPFANAVQEDFAETDVFDFVSPAGRSWTCSVQAHFAEYPDDGFVEITGGDGEPLQVVFRSAHGDRRDHTFPALA